MIFVLAVEQWTTSTPFRVLEGLHVFCGLGEGIQLCPSGVLSGVLWEYGVPDPLIGAVMSLIIDNVSRVNIWG